MVEGRRNIVGSALVGFGKAVPRVMDNDDMAKLVDTNDEWIRTRTGIESRHVAVGESNADLAEQAAREALGWVEGGKTRHETRGACACALHGQYQKARVLGVGKSRLPEAGVFKKIGIPRIGRHRHGTNFFAFRQGII